MLKASRRSGRRPNLASVLEVTSLRPVVYVTYQCSTRGSTIYKVCILIYIMVENLYYPLNSTRGLVLAVGQSTTITLVYFRRLIKVSFQFYILHRTVRNLCLMVAPQPVPHGHQAGTPMILSHPRHRYCDAAEPMT